ncbi:regulatory protein RecX [Rhizosphaericola mali]|uniref:Regulatory protein RecX n=1 Tax=Rhizosphaericola mali TaxID=2545455 RepID=A0A5P2G7X0_9BACT|nr:regulatory protein RecX [Rhizosphaericola mali]QES90379.1 RecX family transcriptional regulator [Rhizosphaericola mali]
MQNRLTPALAFEKIKYFCAYQERSHHEVKDKLYKYGIYSDDIDQIIATLIEENYLNEERFATSYVRGKFKMKHWGKIKITQGLKVKRISSYNIKIGLLEIEEDEYLDVAYKLTEGKWLQLKDEQYINRQAKVIRYMLQKGFELHLITDCIKRIRE